MHAEVETIQFNLISLLVFQSSVLWTGGGVGITEGKITGAYTTKTLREVSKTAPEDESNPRNKF